MPGPFDVFISYCRRDDVGPDGASSGGWVSALKKVLETSSAGGPPLRVFFDTADIRAWEDWRHRILAALRQSKVLVVCLSPAYFESEYCRWEWEHFVRRRGQKHAQGDGESIQAIRLAAFPGTSMSAEWLASVRRGTTRDLSPWTSESPELLQQEGPAREEVQRLVEALVTRVRRAQRESALAYGNMRAATEHFVGRRAQLQALHEHVRLGGVGVLTALHGLGGIGKTELAVFYANEYARSFPAGIWWIDAAPYADLRAAIGALAEVPGFLSTPVPSGSNAEQRFAQVMHTLHNRSRESREQDADEDGQVLLVLDNVDQPVLFSANQRVHVAQHPWLSILVTTRQISEPPDQADRLKVFPLEALDSVDAVALIREWQPGQAFRDAPDAVAADALIRDLDGYTLAVEQVAAFLGGNPDLSIARFHAELQRQGLQSLDQLHDDPAVRGVRLHREGQLKLILEQTLPPVGSLERLLLDYAACFGPDAVPVPWIEALVREHFPEAVSLEPARFGVDPMAKAWRWLEQRRLLTPSSCSELRRMHRLVRNSVLPLRSMTIDDGIDEMLAARLNEFDATHPARWIGACLMDLFECAEVLREDLFIDLGLILGRWLTRNRPRSEAERVLDRTLARINDTLKKSGRQDARLIRNGGLVRMGYADILQRDGNPEAALALYLANQQIFGSFDASNWHDQAVCYAKIAECLVLMGDVEQAWDYFVRSFDICQWRLERDSDDTAALLQQCYCRNKLVELERMTENPNLERITEWLWENEAILASYSAKKRERAMNLCKLGSFLDPSQGRECLLQAIEFHRQILREDPESIELGRDLSLAEYNLALLYFREDDIVNATGVLDQSLNRLKGLVARDPSNVNLVCDVVHFWLLRISLDKSSSAIWSVRLLEYLDGLEIDLSYLPVGRTRHWPEEIMKRILGNSGDSE